MVFVAYTVVHEGTVMVELLDAPVAKVAVERGLWLKVLAMDAHVVQIKVVVNNSF